MRYQGCRKRRSITAANSCTSSSLRKTCSPPWVAKLSSLGYPAEPLSGVNACDVRWYAFDDVRDLSREEAEIIARRVTSAFARPHPLPDFERVRLEQAVADALYSCFASNDLGAGVPARGLRRECCEAVERAVLSLIHEQAARVRRAPIE